MPTKQKTYETLICLTLICFGFFGSLSHIFSLSLIILSFASHRMSDWKNEVDLNSKIVFLGLSGGFFLFFFLSIFHSNLGELPKSLSPMLPLPFIGILVLCHNGTDFQLSAKKISQFAQASIFFSLIIYFLVPKFVDVESDIVLNIYKAGRLTLFSGNPIPFSFVILGISIFCLANWRTSNNQSRLIAFLLFLTGVYFAGFLSGTRGTLLAILIIAPIIFFYLSNSLKISIFIITVCSLTIFVLIKIGYLSNLEQSYLKRIANGLKTIILLKDIDSSAFQRLEMWSAAIKAVSDSPLFGYGITERFSSLEPYLNNSEIKYTHPHNDIFAGLISSGFLGGLGAIISLASPFLAAIVMPQRSSEKVLLGLVISITAFITGNVGTVFFNDISSAWLAFSTYLIWATDFTNSRSKLSTTIR